MGVIKKFKLLSLLCDYDIDSKCLSDSHISEWNERTYKNKMLVEEAYYSPYDIESISNAALYSLNIDMKSNPDKRYKVWVASNCKIPRDIIRRKYDICRSPDNADILVGAFDKKHIEAYSYDYIFLKAVDANGVQHNTYVDITISYYNKGRYIYSYEEVKVQNHRNDAYAKAVELLTGKVKEKNPDYTLTTKVCLGASLTTLRIDDALAELIDRRRFNEKNYAAPFVILDCHLPLDYPVTMNVDSLYALYNCNDKNILFKTLQGMDYQAYPFTYWKLLSKLLYARLPYSLPEPIRSMRDYADAIVRNNIPIKPEDFNLFQDLCFKIMGVEEQGFTSEDILYDNSIDRSYIKYKSAVKKVHIDAPMPECEIRKMFK